MTVAAHSKLASFSTLEAPPGVLGKFWALGRALSNDCQVVDDRLVVRLAGSEIEQLGRLMPLMRWSFSQQDWERVTKLVTNPSPVDLLGGLAEAP